MKGQTISGLAWRTGRRKTEERMEIFFPIPNPEKTPGDWYGPWGMLYIWYWLRDLVAGKGARKDPRCPTQRDSKPPASSQDAKPSFVEGRRFIVKLSTVHIQQALDQFEQQTTVIPDNHPKTQELEEIFGEHTFFLDGDGLEIIEPIADDGNENIQEPAGQVVRVAMWNDAARTTLAAGPAEITGVVIVFPSAEERRVDRAVEESFPASDAVPHSGITGSEEK